MYQSTGLGHAGSTPDFVMRTGAYAVMDPNNARRDVSQGFVNNWTRRSVGRPGNPPDFAQNAPTSVDQGPMAGYFGAGAAPAADHSKLMAYAGSAAVGALGGLVIGGEGRRGTGALLGVLLGGVSAFSTLWLANRK